MRQLVQFRLYDQFKDFGINLAESASSGGVEDVTPSFQQVLIGSLWILQSRRCPPVPTYLGR